MRDLIEALNIFLRYDAEAGTCAQHDVFAVCVDPEIVSDEDKVRLRELGFLVSDGDEWGGCFISFRWGSC